MYTLPFFSPENQIWLKSSGIKLESLLGQFDFTNTFGTNFSKTKSDEGVVSVSDLDRKWVNLS